MQRKYISAVKPLENYILQIDFVSGSRLFLNLEHYLECMRFRPLKMFFCHKIILLISCK